MPLPFPAPESVRQKDERALDCREESCCAAPLASAPPWSAGKRSPSFGPDVGAGRLVRFHPCRVGGRDLPASAAAEAMLSVSPARTGAELNVALFGSPFTVSVSSSKAGALSVEAALCCRACGVGAGSAQRPARSASNSSLAARPSSDARLPFRASKPAQAGECVLIALI